MHPGERDQHPHESKELNIVRKKAVSAIVRPTEWQGNRWISVYYRRYWQETCTYTQLFTLEQEYMKDANMPMQGVCRRDGFIDGTVVMVGYIPYHKEEWELLLRLRTCNWRWTTPTRRVTAIHVPRTPKDGDHPLTLHHAAWAEPTDVQVIEESTLIGPSTSVRSRTQPTMLIHIKSIFPGAQRTCGLFRQDRSRSSEWRRKHVTSQGSGWMSEET